VNHGSVPFVAGLPAEDIRNIDGRNPAYGALLLYRRAPAGLCSRLTGAPVATNLDAAPPRLHANALVRANVHAGHDADSHRDPEARGKCHLHVHSHAPADAHAHRHNHPYAYRDADVHSDHDPYRHPDRHPHHHADTHAHFYDYAHPDAFTHTYRYANVDAEPDTERHPDANTDLHAKPGSSRSMMPVAGEPIQGQGSKICRQRDT